MRKKRTDIDMLAAAYLAAEGNKQTGIADILGLSQTVVSRMLREAKDIHWREQVQFIDDSVSTDEKRQILDRIGRNDLTRKLSDLSQRYCGRPGPFVRILASEKGSAERDRVVHFASQAAAYIHRLFERVEICGVTWGGMLWHLVAALRALAVPSPWSARGLEIVPLSGEPLGDQPTVYSSSSLSYELGRLAVKPDYIARYLGMVPAFIPEGFREQEIAAIWRLIGLVRSYVEIFGSREPEANGRPLAGRLDMVLTSVGPADRPLGFINGRLLETGKVTTAELKELIVGDIGGVCIPRDKLTARQRARLASVTGRWTGWKREHLESCARGATGNDPLSGRPGVVVISIGARRAELVYQAVKLGLINQLIIDQDLAQELDAVLARDGR